MAAAAGAGAGAQATVSPYRMIQVNENVEPVKARVIAALEEAVPCIPPVILGLIDSYRNGLAPANTPLTCRDVNREGFGQIRMSFQRAVFGHELVAWHIKKDLSTGALSHEVTVHSEMMRSETLKCELSEKATHRDMAATGIAHNGKGVFLFTYSIYDFDDGTQDFLCEVGRRVDSTIVTTGSYLKTSSDQPMPPTVLSYPRLQDSTFFEPHLNKFMMPYWYGDSKCGMAMVDVTAGQPVMTPFLRRVIQADHAGSHPSSEGPLNTNNDKIQWIDNKRFVVVARDAAYLCADVDNQPNDGTPQVTFRPIALGDSQYGRITCFNNAHMFTMKMADHNVDVYALPNLEKKPPLLWPKGTFIVDLSATEDRLAVLIRAKSYPEVSNNFLKIFDLERRCEIATMMVPFNRSSVRLADLSILYPGYPLQTACVYFGDQPLDDQSAAVSKNAAAAAAGTNAAEATAARGASAGAAAAAGGKAN